MVTSPHALDVHLYGTHVGVVTRGRSATQPGRIHWEWAPDAAERWGVGSRVVSHNLPIRDDDAGRHARATAFINGLLPEGDLRTKRALDLGIDPDDTYALLHRCGIDTAGAITVTPAGEPPTPPSDEPGPPLGPADITRRLTDAGSGKFRGTLTSISLPGMVPKLGVSRDTDGTWRLPAPGHPSTWIIKQGHPAESQAADVIDTEALCLDLGRRCGITDVDSEILDLGDSRAIAVRRYDRLPDGERLHQEDLAQALGIATDNPERKFQRGRSMPSWRHAASVLQTGGGLLSPLARLVAFSFLVGNTDHHAKNTSFIRHATADVRLAPAYDIAAHLHHPGVHTFALDIAARRIARDVTILHVVDEIASWGIPPGRARDAALDVTNDLQAALHDIPRDAHPGVSPNAWHFLDARATEAEVLLTAPGRR